jgi:HSP20 family protein
MVTTLAVVPTLDRVLDDVIESAFGTATNSRAFEPAIDVRVSDGEVLVLCDMPGVKSEDLDVTLESRVLTIKATRKFDRKDRERVLFGRTYGTICRAYTLPDSCDEENLSASLADGVLTIRIAKHRKAVPRKIPIGAGSDAKQLK